MCRGGVTLGDVLCLSGHEHAHAISCEGAHVYVYVCTRMYMYAYVCICLCMPVVLCKRRCMYVYVYMCMNPLGSEKGSVWEATGKQGKSRRQQCQKKADMKA